MSKLNPNIEIIGNYFKENLAIAPLCTNDFSEGLYRRKRTTAFSKKFIEHDTPNQINFISLDLDRKQSFFAEQDFILPPATLTCFNRTNGHCHKLWALKKPIHRSINSNQKPQRYHQAITRAMALKAKADLNYSGLITKNPLHQSWRTTFVNQFYDLEYLAEFVDLKYIKQFDTEKSLAEGRNLRLFDELRHYAYNYVKTHQNSFKTILEVLLAKGIELNVFNLPLSEIHSIAKSITKFVTTKYNGSNGKITLEQMRGRETMMANAEERRQKAYQLLGKGYSAKEISEDLSVSLDTVKKWMRQLKSV